MSKDEALKLALEALEKTALIFGDDALSARAAKAINEALAQDELCSSQEPVACKHQQQCLNGLQCLCTTPPKRTWVELTAPAIAKIVNALDDQPLNLALAIEAKLKEKNT